MTTVASLYSAANGTVDGELRIDLSCKANEASVVIGGLLDSGRSTRTVGWSVDGGRSQSERWSPWPVEGALELLPPANSGFGRRPASGGRSMTLNVDGRAISTTLDLTALQATPVYANLAECESGANRADRQHRDPDPGLPASGGRDRFEPRAHRVRACSNAVRTANGANESCQVPGACRPTAIPPTGSRPRR